MPKVPTGTLCVCYQSYQVEQEVHTILFYFGCARLITCHPEKENKTYIFLSITARIQFIFLRQKKTIYSMYMKQRM